MLHHLQQGQLFNLQTNKKFRDVNSWYHIVISIDTTDVTSADRCKIYVNGVRETSFSSASYPNQNASVQWSGTGNTQFDIGRRESGGAGLYYDGANVLFSLCRWHSRITNDFW